MHNKIYQIERERVNAEDFITIADFSPEEYDHFADWIDGVDEDNYEELYKRLENLFDGVFVRNGDELTYMGAEKFMGDWLASIKSIVLPMTVDKMRYWQEMYKLHSIIDNTHIRTQTKIYIDGQVRDFGDFMRDVFAEMKVGDKLYLGGIIDFHW